MLRKKVFGKKPKTVVLFKAPDPGPPKCQLCGASVPISPERTYEICTPCVIKAIQDHLRKYHSNSAYWKELLKASAMNEWLYYQLRKVESSSDSV